MGVLRLRQCFASRSIGFAQEDNPEIVSIARCGRRSVNPPGTKTINNQR